jgi:dTDP-4-dehydrorhamnose reductase
LSAPGVLVTGAAGQLGRALLAQAPAAMAVHGVTRAELDISDAAAVCELLDREAPALVINAAAYTAVDRAEEDADAAMAANATAPGILAAACAGRGIRLIHVSTDFVFDGERSTPYPIDAPTRPLGVYGESKLAGELAVRAGCADSLVLRTGWVYGPVGQNFLLTMLRLHGEREELGVVDDQVGTPTSTATLAEALWRAAARRELRGVLHMSDAGVCSWYDFAVAIGEQGKQLGLLSRAADVRPIPSAAYPTPARRPAYSVLDKRDSWRALEMSPRHWRAALRDTLEQLRNTDHG